MSKYRITLDGKTYEMEIERIDGKEEAAQKTPTAAAVAPAPKSVPVPQAQPAPKASSAAPAGGNAVTSPMPGTILRVLAAAGETVKKGQAVLVLEAMKMENEIASPRDGVVSALFVAQGDTVQGGSPLFEIGG